MPKKPAIFMAYMGRRQRCGYFDFYLPGLQHGFQEIESRQDHIKSVLRKMKQQNRRAVEAQFAHVFALLG